MQRNISPVNMICLLLMAVLMLTGIRAEAGHLEEIVARGTIRIGTTGDYIPMSYLNPQTGEYEGIDAELSKIIADSLGVKIQYVPTTWPTLAADTQAGKFDIALCGISRNYNRAKIMAMSDAYLKQAQIIVYNDNADIPRQIAEGRADIMITETVEAAHYVRMDKRLAAPLKDSPFTRHSCDILMEKGDQEWLNYINFVLAELRMDGTLAKMSFSSEQKQRALQPRASIYKWR
ncbi:cyclohexadienyl dehydratase [Selenomonas ruminantium]|uniref:Cyclohexadienyl dehydratase n=1 Tax=Selenomonas ruminantium TaxID=971 RepID=A0A1M6XZZ6_SELRU|nr:transporter substrate-binding domain-containing protein [Selenomonas ruminantium]SHL11439.1 cyclohexadienyl dehydratase [Selenomonas ruminantium]